MGSPITKRGDGHGVQGRERAILDAVDAGVPRAQVAADFGVKRSYVDHVVSKFPINDIAHRQWAKTAAASNDAFLLAIARAGGRAA